MASRCNKTVISVGSESDAKSWAPRIGAVGNPLPTIQRPYDAASEGVYPSFLCHVIHSSNKDNYHVPRSVTDSRKFIIYILIEYSSFID